MTTKFLLIVLILDSASFAPMAMGVEIGLNVSGSALWTGGRAVTLAGDILVTGHPDGIRVWRSTPADLIELTGQLEIAAGVRDLVVSDSMVYGLDGLGHAFIASISSPSHPINLGGFGPAQEWTALAMSGRFLIAGGADSAISYDLSDPVHPLPSGKIVYNGQCVAIAAHDSLLLIAQGAGGLLVGIRHPDGTISGKGNLASETVGEIVTDGSYGWSPQGDSGVVIIDLTDPALPHSVAHIYTYGHADHVALSGDRILVADSRIGLISYRLITGPVPFWQSELNGISGITGIAAESPSRFYIAVSGELSAVDVDPAGQLTFTSTVGHQGAYGPVLRYRDWIFVGGSTGMWRSDGAAFISDSNFVHLSPNAVFGAAQSGDELATAEGHSGAAVYRINNDGYFETLSRIQAETFTCGVIFGHDTLMVLDSLYGFQVYDLTNPSSPPHLGGRTTDLPTQVGAIYRNFLYLSEPPAGVSIWNWEHLAKPERLGILPHTSATASLLIDNDRLYVADSDSGLSIFSLATPSNPSLLGRIGPPFSPTALQRSSRLLYVGQGDGTVSAVDVENPASPAVLAETKIAGGILGLSKLGERLWVSTQTAIHTVDVDPPLLPGDFNADGAVDIFDVVAMIGYCFSEGTPPYRPNAADVNADGQTNLIDIVLTIDYIFSGGAALLPGRVE